MHVCACTCPSYTFQLLVNTRRQHDAGHNGLQQERGRVDASGHCGVSAAQTAAAHQTRRSTAETRNLEPRTTGHTALGFWEGAGEPGMLNSRHGNSIKIRNGIVVLLEKLVIKFLKYIVLWSLTKLSKLLKKIYNNNYRNNGHL